MKGLKIQIPDQLKEAMPHTTWGKILTATPVVMAVVSTMLAGLASSEMTRAQYDRSLAAQQQSKAGDQWSFFQAKRLRGALQKNTSDLLQTVTPVRPLSAESMRTWAQRLPESSAAVKERMLSLLDSDAGRTTILCLQKGEVPFESESLMNPQIKSALAGLEELVTDAEMAVLLAPISSRQLEEAVRVCRDRAQAYDNATKPINKGIDQFESLLGSPEVDNPAAEAGPSLKRDFTAARLKFSAQRYETEGRLNQAIANLYELQVRKSNISAERHHYRSQRFFFGMLGAQMGVIISTFAMAAQKRNLLWSLAAGAGILAIAFALYVYLWV